MDDAVELALQRYLAAEQELEAARWALIEAANARVQRTASRAEQASAPRGQPTTAPTRTGVDGVEDG